MLTAEHEQTKTLKVAQLREIVSTRTFEQIMRLPMWERAEVLEYLQQTSAMVKMKANQAEPIAFGVTDPYRRLDPEDDAPLTFEFEIPGGEEKPREFPINAAIFVYSNRDQRQFGGAYFKGGDIDEVTGNLKPVIRVPENPKLISFELVQRAKLVTSSAG
jgi:hypothetical protein